MAASDDSAAGDVALGAVKRWYHVPVLAGLVIFMFWSRFQNYDAFTREGDGVWLQAVDSWYHWRATNWMVENVPWTLSYETWTGFPDGISPGQFGTLFDQIVVTVAMGFGLGSPSESDVLLAALVAVPAIAALVALPVYYIGKRLGTRIGGLAGAGVLALFTGEFFRRSTAGQFQHHAAEALFMALAVLAVIAALTVAERERPVWELVRKGDWDALRPSTLYSALAGLAVTLYIWVWPPGVVLVGILGLYFVVQFSVDQYRGRSPEHLAFVGVISMAIVAVGTALRIQQPGFSATGLDFFQPTFAVLVAGGCVFMAGLARLWDESDLPRRGYPAAVGVSILGALGVLAVVVPGVFETLTNNLTGRIVPFGQSDSALTVAEVDPPDSFFGSFVQEEYGWAFYTALVALPVLAVQSILRPEERAKYLLVLVWALVLISMGMSQVRFNYYLAVAVAVLNAHLVGFFSAGIELPDSTDQLEGSVSAVRVFQGVLVVVLLAFLVVPLVPPVASTTPLESGEQTGPSPDAVVWESSNEWLAENTPEVGNYGGAGNADELDYNGRYGFPDGGSFDYPEGAYGVMSWWDYGHLITVQGERIPHANPFQQNARSASAFLTAQNETRAELYLDAIAAGESVTHESNESELRAAVEESNDPPGIQYVMIDDESAAGKFPAITEWTGPDYLDYLEEEERTFVQGAGENQTQTSREVFAGGAYYDTMLSRLYLEDANRLEHFRLVHESPRYSIVGFFGNTQSSQRIGVFGDVAASSGNQSSLADTMESFSQARAGDFGLPLGPGQFIHDPYVASTVKTFERVEGATLTGETDLNGSVRATVTLRTGTNRTFSYNQSTEIQDGSFEMTVAYPTDETLSPADGYANASVRADGGYTLTATDETGLPVEEATEVTVPEEDIQTGGTVDVELAEIPDPPEANLSNVDIAGQGTEGTVMVGENESISADVTNVGEEPGGFDLSLEIDGNTTATTTVEELDPGENTTVTFTNTSTGTLDPGVYPVQVVGDDDSASAELTVEEISEPESSLAGLDVGDQGENATVTAGAETNVSVTVGNIGDLAGSFDLTLAIGQGVELSTSTTELASGQTETVTFDNVTVDVDPGSYNLTVATLDDSVAGALTVEESTVTAVRRPARAIGVAG
jgi:oligosaccharyl transferase (archaeosortase A-associated)